MSIGSVYTLMVALFKAIPAAERMFRELIDLYTDYKISQVKKEEISIHEERDALNRAIRNAKDDKELIALSRVLHDYNFRMPK